MSANPHHALPDEVLPAGVAEMLHRVAAAKGVHIRAVLYHWRNTIATEAGLMSLSAYQYYSVHTAL